MVIAAWMSCNTFSSSSSLTARGQAGGVDLPQQAIQQGRYFFVIVHVRLLQTMRAMILASSAARKAAVSSLSSI